MAWPDVFSENSCPEVTQGLQRLQTLLSSELQEGEEEARAVLF